MLMFCGADQLPFPQKTLAPFINLYSPRAAQEPQEKKEAVLQRALLYTNIPLHAFLLLTTDRILPTASIYQLLRGESGTISPNPLPPYSSFAIPSRVNALATHTKCEVRQHGKMPITLALGKREMYSVCKSEDF